MNQNSTKVRFTMFFHIMGFLAVIFLIRHGCFSGAGEIITVEEDGTGNFTQLGPALEYSENNDTILVGPGNYTGSYRINSSVVIKSKDGPNTAFLSPEYVLDNGTYILKEFNGFNTIFFVNTSNVTVEGLDFSLLPAEEVPGESDSWEFGGNAIFITANVSENLLVRNNSFFLHPEQESLPKDFKAYHLAVISLRYIDNVKSYEGIILDNNYARNINRFVYSAWFYNHDNITITNNHIVGRTNTSANSSSANFTTIAIGIPNLRNSEITGNTVMNFKLAIYSYGVENSTIVGNTFSNTRLLKNTSASFCMDFYESNNNEIINNEISEYDTGINIRNSGMNLKINSNKFLNNTRDINCLKNFLYSEVLQNNFSSSGEEGHWGPSLTIQESYGFSMKNNSWINKSTVSLFYNYNLTFDNNSLVNTDVSFSSIYAVFGGNNSINGKKLLIISNTKDRNYSITDPGKIIILNSKHLKIFDVETETETRSSNIFISQSSHINVINSSFKNSVSAGIEIVDSDDCRVVSSEFGSGNTGILVDCSKALVVEDCFFSNLTNGIRMKSSNLSFVVSSEFVNCHKGLELYDSAFISIMECTFQTNDYGLDSSIGSGLIIIENIFESSVFSGIHIYAADNVKLMNNTITGGSRGIQMENSANAQLEDNIIGGFQENGVALNSSSNNALMTGNIIMGQGDFGTGLLVLYSNSNNISRNNITNCGQGIRIHNSTKNICTNNSIQRNIQGVIFTGIIIGNEFSYNSIENNTLGAVAEDIVGKVDMSWNYWGSPMGPYHPKNNSHADGDQVSDNITFMPYQKFPDEVYVGKNIGGMESEEEYAMGLTKSQFQILVVDLVIVIGVFSVVFTGYYRFRKNSNSN